MCACGSRSQCYMYHFQELYHMFFGVGFSYYDLGNLERSTD